MKHIWIINHKTSTNLFYRNYSDISIDPDLISGLLAALDSFSETELRSHGISSIEMGGLRWAYSHHPENNIMLISAAQKSAHAEIMKSRLEVIYQEFVKKYQITSEKMQRNLIDISDFRDFAEDLDTLLAQWDEAEALINGGAIKIFDLLGIFQQIFNYMNRIIRMNFFKDNYEATVHLVDNILKKLKKTDDFENFPELKKIRYEKTGWDLLQIDPKIIDIDCLKRTLFTITTEIDQILRKKLSNMTRLHAYSRDMFPYIIQQYEMLEYLDILPVLLKIFLG